jgi:hypothetical protein
MIAKVRRRAYSAGMSGFSWVSRDDLGVVGGKCNRIVGFLLVPAIGGAGARR